MQRRWGFCLLKPGTFQAVTLPDWTIGADVSATVAGQTGSALLGGESLRPVSPVNLSAVTGLSGELVLRWTRRSRLGLAWLGGVDAPLGESSELYRVALTGPLAAVELEASQPELTVDTAMLATIGAGPVIIRVRQVGDLLASRPAELNIVTA